MLRAHGPRYPLEGCAQEQRDVHECNVRVEKMHPAFSTFPTSMLVIYAPAPTVGGRQRLEHVVEQRYL